MGDPYKSYFTDINGTAEHAAEVTTSDSEDLATEARWLWVGGYGNVKLTTWGGETITYVGVQGYLFSTARRVWQNGTSATNIVACW